MSQHSEKNGENTAQRGYTMLEMMVVVTIIGIMACLAAGAFQRIREQSASESLLTVLESLLGEARTTAVQSLSNVGIRFFERGGKVYARLYKDGDGDGVCSEDVARGTDRPLGQEVALCEDQSRVAIPEGATSDPAGKPLAGEGPVRFGRGETLTFSPTATATPGSLYISEGDGRSGWAVRVAGIDGRIRLWRFKHGTWNLVQPM